MRASERKPQKKHRKSKRGHGCSELKKIKMDCIWSNIKDVAVFQVCLSYNAIYDANRVSQVSYD